MSDSPIDPFGFCSHLERVEWSTGHCDASDEDDPDGALSGFTVPVAGTLEGPKSQVKLMFYDVVKKQDRS